MMKLQMSMDLIGYEDALELVGKVYDVIDIIEVGTPLIATEGTHLIKAIREKYADVTILADTKIMDGGEYVPSKMFEAGANIVTVLAAAEDATIKKVIKTAKKYGGQTVIDMIAIKDLKKRVEEVDGWGADYIGVHVGVDIQGGDKNPLTELRKLTSYIQKTDTAVAGGVSLETIPDLVKENPGVIICGKSIVNAEDPRQTILDMKKLMGNR